MKATRDTQIKQSDALPTELTGHTANNLEKYVSNS